MLDAIFFLLTKTISMTTYSKHSCYVLNVSILSKGRERYNYMDDGPTDDHDQQGQEEEDGVNEDELYASSGNTTWLMFQ